MTGTSYKRSITGLKFCNISDASEDYLREGRFIFGFSLQIGVQRCKYFTVNLNLIVFIYKK